MKTSIETRNGKPVTVIREPFAEKEAWVREQLEFGRAVVVEDMHGAYALLWGYDASKPDRAQYATGTGWYPFEVIAHVVTVLPALPSIPKTENDMRILSAYMAAGLKPVAQFGYPNQKYWNWPCEGHEVLTALVTESDYKILPDGITHAVDAEGNRHEIAIKGVSDAQ